MFPITHIWFSRRILGRVNNLTVLGSIFPDIVISGCMSYEQTHNTGWGLYSFFKEHFSGMLDFVKAEVTHTVNPRGLDFFGDEEYGRGKRGYCFQKGSLITEEVVKACNIPESFGLWKAHNFIEMGIEINIINVNKELVALLQDALDDKELIKELAYPIEKFFSIKKYSIAESFQRFSGFLELGDLNSTSLAVKYDRQMDARHGIRIDIGRCADIIEKSRYIAAADFDEFINFCTDKVSRLLEGE